ncbi:MAG: flagellar FliL protein [Paracoccaceae bacterium]|jgi:flagellar FliL protein
MSDAVADSIEEPAKGGKMKLMLLIVLALAGAGGGFYLVQSGLIPTGSHDSEMSEGDGGHREDHGTPKSLDDIAFVEVDPIMISLHTDQHSQHLRFRAQLEVASDYQHEVESVLPRVTDVLNSYLRALELDDLRDPLALTRLRAQMLRRIQVVVGKERVRDLLIMEFVLN